MKSNRLIVCFFIIGLIISSIFSSIKLSVEAAEEYLIEGTNVIEEKRIKVDTTTRATFLNINTLSLVNENCTYQELYYDQLDSDSKYVYDTLYEYYEYEGSLDTIYITDITKTWYDVSFTITDNTNITFVDDNIRSEMLQWAKDIVIPADRALEYDHPELAWISGADFYVGCEINFESFSYIENDDGTYTGDFPAYVTCRLESVSTTLNADDISDMVNEAMENIDSGSTYETIVSIYNYIVERDYYATGDTNDLYYQTVVSSLSGDGDTVCMGYTLAFKLLCDQYDIPCAVISGIGVSEAHAWNYVKIDNKWYAVDVTWGDDSESNEWFLVGSDTFYEDHTEDPSLNSSGAYVFVYPVIETSKYISTEESNDSDDNDSTSSDKVWILIIVQLTNQIK